MGVLVRATLIIVFICFSFHHVAIGQDARFSQITNAPLMLNSSLTGRTSGGMELGILNSSQTSNKSEIANQHVFFHANSDQLKILKNNFDTTSIKMASNKYQNYWGFGMHYYHYGNDLLGFRQSTTPLNGNFYSISLAKHFYKKSILGYGTFFGVGFSATIANGKLNEGKGLVNDAEISGGGFRYRPTAANNASSTRNYADFNIGAYYGFRFNAISFETGVGLNHIVQPRNDIFDDEETKQRVRGTVYTSLGLPISKQFSLFQKNIFWQEGLYLRSKGVDSSFRNEIWSGFEFKRRNPGSKKIQMEGGIYTRSIKTVMPFASLLIGNGTNIKFSYEWPINKVRFNAYDVNRFETSVVLSFGKKYFNRRKDSDNYLAW